MADAQFADRLVLVMKALSISRGRLAAEVGIDKSVVGRWCTGAVLPSAHSLERLTHLIAGKAPGFSLLDWDRDLDALAERLGVDAPPVAPSPLSQAVGPGDMVAPALLAEARANAAMHGAAYEGLWRTTRPSPDHGGIFVHDHMIQRRAANGLLHHRLGVFGLRFDGWAMPIQNQIFTVASDAVSGVFIFSIVKGVARSKAEVLDGLTLTCLRNTDGDIVASPCVFERVGDLTGDDAADDAAFEALMGASPFVAAETIAPDIRRVLLPDIGPAAQAAGGELLLMMRFAASLSRAAPVDGGRFRP